MNIFEFINLAFAFQILEYFEGLYGAVSNLLRTGLKFLG